MKTTLRRLTVATLGLAILTVSTATVQAQFNYVVTNGTITITKYTGPGGAVTIPDRINGLPVTSIGDYAFSYCVDLTNVTIPRSVTNLGKGAFCGCTGLSSLVIPGSVTDIANEVFRWCSSLTSLNVDEHNPAYHSTEGVLFNKNQTALVQYPGGRTGSYIIPNSVTRIGGSAFSDCTGLSSVVIPDSVVSIEDGDSSFPSFGAFNGCTSLTNVEIGNSATHVGVMAFFNCSSLTNITIPNNVTNLGDSAFSSCSGLTNVTLGNSVSRIGNHAFYHCTTLTSITIPTSVTSIGHSVFLFCTRLTAITVDVLNPVYSSLDGVVFNKSRTTLLSYPQGKSGSYTIPNSVTNIGGDAFYSCTNLTTVTIPSGVTVFSPWDFVDCESLTAIYFEGNAPRVEVGQFEPWNNPGTAYYLPGSSGWGSTFGPTFAERPTALWIPHVQTTAPAFGIHNNQFGFTISWARDQVVVVEATVNLSNPIWLPVSTNTIASDGVDYFVDPDSAKYSSRFYRIRSH